MIKWVYREFWEEFSVTRGILAFYAILLILVVIGVTTGILPKLP